MERRFETIEEDLNELAYEDAEIYAYAYQASLVS